MNLPVRWRWKLNRLRDQLKEFFARKEEAPRPKLCPACGKLVGANESRCGECGASTTFSLAAASKTLSRLLPQENPASYSILLLSALLYTVSLTGTLAQQGSSAPISGGPLGGLFSMLGVKGEILYRLGASMPLAYNLAEPWRFITAIFLHASLLHIVFNMWALLDLGPLVEELYGSARFLFVYVLAGIGGSLLSSLFGSSTVGASGAVVGLMGVLLAATGGRRSAGTQMFRDQLIRWIIYVAAFSLLHGISFLGHLGGGLTGFLLGKIMAPNPPLNPRDRKWANLMGWAAGLAIVASFAMVIVTYRQP